MARAKNNATTESSGPMGGETDCAPEYVAPFRCAFHSNLRAECGLANLLFNDSDWFRQDGDVRRQFGEGDIRRALIEANSVDCMDALPGQRSYSTQIAVCL